MDAELEHQLKACKDLPSLSGSAIQIMQLCQRPDFAINELSQAISRDPALSAKLIKTVNSPFFGLSKKVTSVRRALVLLGANSVRTLAMTISVLGNLHTTREVQHHNWFWRRSLIAASVSRALARGYSFGDPELAFLAGLLQDIGVLSLMQALGRPYTHILTLTFRNHHESLIHERRSFNADHIEVGLWFAKRWSLPEEIRGAIASSHGKVSAVGNLKINKWVSVSGPVADIFMGEGDRDDVYYAREQCRKVLNLDEADFESLLDEVARDLPALSRMLDVELIDIEQTQAAFIAAREALWFQELETATPGQTEVLPRATLEQFQQEDRIRFDTITGLCDKRRFPRMFEAKFERALESRQPLSVIACSIRRFNALHMLHGRDFCESVLAGVGKVVQALLRDVDLASRTSTDDLVVVLMGADEDGAERFSRTLQSRISKLSFPTDEGGLQVSAFTGTATAFGIARYHFSGHLPLLEAALTALGQASQEETVSASYHMRKSMEVVQFPWGNVRRGE